MKEKGEMLKDNVNQKKKDRTKTKNEGFLAEFFCGFS